MPLFTYEAFTVEGRRVSQREHAPTAHALRERLRRSGLFIRAGSIRERRRWWNNPRRTRLTSREVIDLFQHLELQLGAGVLSHEAISSMMEHEPSRRSRCVLREIHEAITNGRMSISDAFGLFPRAFPAALVTVIRAGEKAGAMELGRRFGDLRSRLEFNRGIRSIALRAFQYPALIAALACVFVGFVFALVVPVLAKVLESVNVTLPPITRALIAVSHFVVGHWVLLVGVGAAIPLSWYAARRMPAVALAQDRTLMRLPYFGVIYKSIACSIVFRTYASLYEAGEPAPEILELCTGLVRNRAMRGAIVDVRTRVLRGDPLHVAFRKTNCFPPDACAMVRTGESAGLSTSMRLSAQYHAAYARDRIAFAASWLEPAGIVVIGAFVGLVAYAFFTPILSIYEGIR